MAQDYSPRQYVVVDDGSTDDTRKVLQPYAGRIEIIRHKNLGQYATINKAFHAARGEIIGMVNSDGPPLPGAVARLVKELVDHRETAVVYPHWSLIDPQGLTIRTSNTFAFSCENMVRWFSCFPGPAKYLGEYRVRLIKVFKGILSFMGGQ